MITLIENGSVVDFDQNALTEKNIYIQDGKIVDTVTDMSQIDTRLDASGLIVSPGFIDIHMHEEDIQTHDDTITKAMMKMGVTTAHGGNCGINISDFDAFLNQKHYGVNYLLSIGYNDLRLKEKLGHYETASIEILDRIVKKIKEKLELGGTGLSFGLEYSPGISYEELYYVCDALIDYDPLISIHFRKDMKGSIDSVKEMIQLALDVKLRIQISHIGSCSATGYMEETLQLIDEARDNGADIEADCYPYNAFSTYIGSAVFDGNCFEDWEMNYSDLIITGGKYQGQVCTQEIFNDIRENYPDTLGILPIMKDAEVLQALSHPYIYLGSDGLLNDGNGHPRGAGSFPKFLGHYARELGAFTWVEALRKVTLNSAQRLNLLKKGELKIGYDADITVFDPNTIKDQASWLSPLDEPLGIKYVFINGELAVENNQLLSTNSGKIIKKRI